MKARLSLATKGLDSLLLLAVLVNSIACSGARIGRGATGILEPSFLLWQIFFSHSNITPFPLFACTRAVNENGRSNEIFLDLNFFKVLVSSRPRLSTELF